MKVRQGGNCWTQRVVLSTTSSSKTRHGQQTTTSTTERGKQEVCVDGREDICECNRWALMSWARQSSSHKREPLKMPAPKAKPKAKAKAKRYSKIE